MVAVLHPAVLRTAAERLRASGPRHYELLKHYETITEGIILNTSFNLHGRAHRVVAAGIIAGLRPFRTHLSGDQRFLVRKGSSGGHRKGRPLTRRIASAAASSKLGSLAGAHRWPATWDLRP